MDQLEEELNKNVELLSQNHDCELMKGNLLTSPNLGGLLVHNLLGGCDKDLQKI